MRVTDDVFAQAKKFSIYDLLKPYCHGLKPESAGAKSYEGPCPNCGGTNRFSITVKNNSCHCRKRCGISGDIVTAWATLRGLTNLEAAKEIIGETVAPKQWKPKVVEYVAPAPVSDWKSKEWQQKAKISRQMASQRTSMLNTFEPDLALGKQFWSYLDSRGLRDYETEFGLGIANAWNPAEKVEMPAIVIPWIYNDWLTNLKYRFISSDRLRFTSMAGGNAILFGSHLECQSMRGTLSEGEFNAMSIKLACPDYHAWSIGAQGNDLGIDAAVFVAKRRGIEEMVLFFDEYEYALRAKEKFTEAGIGAKAVCSQFGDANDLLVRYGGEWLSEVVEGAFRSGSSRCDRCSGLGVIPYMHSGIYQICPECAKSKEDNA